MLKIRLKRVGRKHDPSFRVVLIESKKGPKSGKINEILGFYDARKDIKELKAEEIKSWISKGAQVSNTVHNILVGEKIIEGKKINVLPRKSPIVKEKVEEEVKKEASAETPTDSTEGGGEVPKAKSEKNEAPAPETPQAEPAKEETPAETEDTPAEEVEE